MSFYRKEIDGLRTIAVIPVILFHAGVELFSGGFVGVDIFFVISGYLITTIILKEKENGNFSLMNFYERRARRIAPALFLVMGSTILAAWLWLSPAHMEDFSQSLVAVPLFVSNILFYLESGYWGVENELKPLLHTWSLAVEEQYYVLFPLFLMLMWKFSKKWLISSFFIIALASFLLADWLSIHNPSAGFFLLSSRAWELAIGAGIAFYFLYYKSEMHALLEDKKLDDVLSFLGLGLIAYAMFVFDEHTPFPGVYALIPTVGTALIIIFSSDKTIVGKVLGSKIFVGIGLISYSAYLWHQPLFSFAKHLSLTEPTLLTLLTLAVLSLVLAYLSWRFVEAPFRDKNKYSRKKIFTFTVAGSLFLVVFGSVGYLTKGFEFRLKDDVAHAINLATEKISRKQLCEQNAENETPNHPYCTLIPSDNKFIFLYGDSHTSKLLPTAKSLFEKTNHGLLASSTRGCPSILGISRLKGTTDSCYEHNKAVYQYLIQTPEIEYIILSARWTELIEGTRFDNQEGGIEPGKKSKLGVAENNGFVIYHPESNRELLAKAFSNSINTLLRADKKVILMYPVPEAGWDVPDYIVKYSFNHPELAFDAQVASTGYDVFKARNKNTYRILDELPAHPNFYKIKPEDLFCNTVVMDRCVTQNNGAILYSDNNHLSNAGALQVLERILTLL